MEQREEDGSTIQTNKSIPHNINVINDKFITGWKYRTNDFPQDTVDEYNNSLHKAINSHSGKCDTNRRLSGFSKAISPNEPEFHPTMNEHVQGIPQMNTNTQLMLKAAAQQHVIQNILNASVEPQLHKVQFTSPMISNTPVHPPYIPKQSSENEHPNNPYDQPMKIHHQMHIIPPPTQQRKLFERKSLPESLIWKVDKEFEKWHNAYEAYIGQQHHLIYILEEKFHAIYLQHGQNKYLTLGLANITRVSPNVKYISVEQFEIDLSFFLIH